MAVKEYIKICPSVLACDFSRIGQEVQRLEEAGSDWLHLDVMDGHFVSNITFGPQMVAAINRKTDLFLDVHLMMYNPYDYVERFIEAGADLISFHVEATEDVADTLNFIRTCNVKSGLAISPKTSIDMVSNYLTICDMVLVMTVEPGFGGQSFIQESLARIQYVRGMCNAMHIRKGGVVVEEGQEGKLAPFDIQVDGGINFETAKQCAQAGANSFVSGSFLVAQKEPKLTIDELRTISSENFNEHPEGF